MEIKSASNTLNTFNKKKIKSYLTLGEAYASETDTGRRKSVLDDKLRNAVTPTFIMTEDSWQFSGKSRTKKDSMTSIIS